MNAKFVILSTLLAAPFCVFAQSDIPTAETVRAEKSAPLIKSCSSPAHRQFLSRNEVASGFGRAWEPAMEPLRRGAISEARVVCTEGWSGVQFSFVRGSDANELAIATGNGAGAVDAAR